MELRRFEKEGVLEPIEFSNWAAPIVALLKSDGKVRICGDFRVSVNPALKVDEYPIPKVEDLLATLAGGKSFTKLDFNQAYTQLALDKECKGANSDQYTQRVVLLYKVAFLGVLGTGYFSANYGNFAPKHTQMLW